MQYAHRAARGCGACPGTQSAPAPARCHGGEDDVMLDLFATINAAGQSVNQSATNLPPTPSANTHPQLVAHGGEVELRGPDRVCTRLQGHACVWRVCHVTVIRFRQSVVKAMLYVCCALTTSTMAVYSAIVHTLLAQHDSPDTAPSAATRTPAPLWCVGVCDVSARLGSCPTRLAQSLPPHHARNYHPNHHGKQEHAPRRGRRRGKEGTGARRRQGHTCRHHGYRNASHDFL